MANVITIIDFIGGFELRGSKKQIIPFPGKYSRGFVEFLRDG
jgi:hypothetical protein